jgi:hypothetical protein
MPLILLTTGMNKHGINQWEQGYSQSCHTIARSLMQPIANARHRGLGLFGYRGHGGEFGVDASSCHILLLGLCYSECITTMLKRMTTKLDDDNDAMLDGNKEDE